MKACLVQLSAKQLQVSLTLLGQRLIKHSYFALSFGNSTKWLSFPDFLVRTSACPAKDYQDATVG